MHTLHTSIEINTPPIDIWTILINTQNYPKWNPLIIEIDGEFEQDENVTIRLSADEESIYERVRMKLEEQNLLEGSLFEKEISSINKTSDYEATVHLYVEQESIEWGRSSLLLGTYLHRFTLSPTAEGKTLFENEIQMSGALVSMGWDKFIKHYYEAGLELMNASLKIKAETNENYYLIDETV